MTDCILFIPGTNKPRHIPPPLPPIGGGFYYLKRLRDGAILLKRGGGYWQFDSESEARGYTEALISEPVAVCFMPRLRAH